MLTVVQIGSSEVRLACGTIFSTRAPAALEIDGIAITAAVPAMKSRRRMMNASVAAVDRVLLCAAT